MITLRNVKKYYKLGGEEIRALDGIDLAVEEGEFLSIVGPSGSGKSTLMHVIGGLDNVDKGEVIVDGIHLTETNDGALADYRNKQVGFVFQTFNLQPTLTAVGNVMLPLIFSGVSGGRRKEMAEEALTQVGLANRMNHKPSELSGGQRQRVSIARALVNKPKIILADEPTGNLDSKTGEAIVKLLDELNEKNDITMVVVTHDMDIAEACDRIVTLRDGKVVEDRDGKRNHRRSEFVSEGKVDGRVA